MKVSKVIPNSLGWQVITSEKPPVQIYAQSQLTKENIESLIIDYTEQIAHYKQISYIEGRLHSEAILTKLCAMLRNV